MTALVWVALGLLLAILVTLVLVAVLRPVGDSAAPPAGVRITPTPRQLYVQRLRATGDRHHAEFADILEAEGERSDETGADLAARYRCYAGMRTVEFQRPNG